LNNNTRLNPESATKRWTLDLSRARYLSEVEKVDAEGTPQADEFPRNPLTEG
jgi:hypothetical protein